MESLHLSQVLADLSNLGAAEPRAAVAIISANSTIVKTESTTAPATASVTPDSSTPQHQRRPSGIQRALSSDGAKFDKFGRRILVNSSRSGSAANSIPGTPKISEFEDDVDRASTLIALYDIRSKLKQQDNSSLMKAREKINALAARQQAQQAAERNSKAADELRRNRYSFPKSGL